MLRPQLIVAAVLTGGLPLSRLGGSSSFVKPPRATTGPHTGPLIARFSDDLVSRLNKHRHKLPAQFGS
jgi:hypothetical protein